MKKLYDKGLALGTGKSTLTSTHEEVIATHEEGATELFNVTITEVTPIQRQYVKTMRFIALYPGDAPK